MQLSFKERFSQVKCLLTYSGLLRFAFVHAWLLVLY